MLSCTMGKVLLPELCLGRFLEPLEAVRHGQVNKGYGHPEGLRKVFLVQPWGLLPFHVSHAKN